MQTVKSTIVGTAVALGVGVMWLFRRLFTGKDEEPWPHPVLYISPDKKIEETLPPHPGGGCTRIVCVSDTHTQERLVKVPPGELLIHSGDTLFKNKDADGNESIAQAHSWLMEQSFKKLVAIGGNHEILLDEAGPEKSKAMFPGYIEDELVEFNGLRIWGSPMSRPYKHGGEVEDGDALGANKAFQTNTFARVEKIPEDVSIDVLITHGAPKGFCETVGNMGHVGCPVLAQKVQKVRPRVHIFGHVHNQSADPNKRVFIDQDTMYVNACNMHDFAPKPGGELYPVVVIDLPPVQARKV